MRRRIIIAFTAVIAAALLAASSGGAAEMPPVDIERLVQEAPPLEEYSGASGVIWQKKINYNLLADGSMERKSLWVILGTGNMPHHWKRWKLAVPLPGNIEVTESAIYDPVTAKLIAPLVPQIRSENGLRTCEIGVPEFDDAYVLVISYNETFPARYFIDDLVWLDQDLPTWEGLISVNIPAGAELNISSNYRGEVSEDRVGAVRRYRWSFFNMPGKAASASLLRDAAPYVAFSLRRGISPLAQYVSSLETESWPPLSGILPDLAKMPNAVKAGERAIAYLADSRRSVEGSSDWIRTGVDLPSDGPWTERERALILASWLKELGWGATVYWLSPVALSEEMPGSSSLLTRPVLKLSPPGSEPWFYLFGQSMPLGRIPAEILGRTLYSFSNGDVMAESIPSGDVADHRLTMEWRLKLNEDGEVAGVLDVLVRNGWTGIFPSREDLSRDSLLAVFPGLSRFMGPLNDGGIKGLKYGYKLSIPVASVLGIPGGRGMLLGFPDLLPAAVLNLPGANESFELRFPFVVEQHFEIEVPQSFGVGLLPALRNMTFENCKLEERMTFRDRKHIVEASLKMVMDADRVTGVAASDLSRLIRRWLQWRGISVPLIRK